MNKDQPFVVSNTTRGRFKHNATERTKALVAKTYRIMKDYNLFYTFQRSFLPMRGLSESDEKAYSSSSSLANIYDLGQNLRYDPNPSTANKMLSPGEEIRRDRTTIASCTPDVLKDINLIRGMIVSTGHYGKGSEASHMSKNDVYGLYAKKHFEGYKDTHKVKPTDLQVEFLFGIILTVLFTVSIMLTLAAISKTLGLVFGSFLLAVTTVALVLCILTKPFKEN